jgi:hypothetical protein
VDERGERVLARAVEGLRRVDGLVAIVLGGSHARGVARPDSDLDLGLYYRPAAPPDLAAVRALARALDDSPDPVVTDLHDWGEWVNGGAWLTVEGQRLDFLYRDLDLIERVVAECEAGDSVNDFWQQLPYGFFSHIYLGELQACRPLDDPDGVIAALKARVAVYPPALKRDLVQGWLWTAAFGHESTVKLARRGDVYSTVGCLTRAAAALTQVLFALNEVHFVSDKDALAQIEALPLRPARYRARLEAALAHPGADPDRLVAAAGEVGALIDEVVALAGDLYRPRY